MALPSGTRERFKTEKQSNTALTRPCRKFSTYVAMWGVHNVTVHKGQHVLQKGMWLEILHPFPIAMCIRKSREVVWPPTIDVVFENLTSIQTVKLCRICKIANCCARQEGPVQIRVESVRIDSVFVHELFCKEGVSTYQVGYLGHHSIENLIRSMRGIPLPLLEVLFRLVVPVRHVMTIGHL